MPGNRKNIKYRRAFNFPDLVTYENTGEHALGGDDDVSAAGDQMFWKSASVLAVRRIVQRFLAITWNGSPMLSRK